ncbi:MAG TPA: squalene/phytoene synthase family protein, partial [Hyphomicrobiaceae bacterium]|nr:squalene/phytoene synthase family protein [Hyphomicrobiaceae bacterium]
MTMPDEAQSTVDPEIVERARSHEPDRYLAALLSPLTVRADLLALVAFTADLVRIPTVVTEPMMGEIRLQWWRDQFGPLAGGATTAHPLADALGRAIRTHHLPVPLLTAMTEARAFDLYADPLTDEAALEGYMTKTEAIPFELTLRILGVDEAVAGRLAQPAGRAFG